MRRAKCGGAAALSSGESGAEGDADVEPYEFDFAPDE